MRTRRSPRNQDRLFAYLFKPEPVKPIVSPHLEMSDEEIDANYPNVRPRTRNMFKREARQFRIRKWRAERRDENRY